MGGEHYKGGHELEGLSAKRISLIVLGLVLVAGTAAVVVSQWFFSQRDELILEGGQQSGWSSLKDQRDWEGQQLKGVDDAARKLIQKPENLGGTVPPTGWLHPDDVKAAGAAAPEPKTEGM